MLLDQVGLADRADDRYRTLSGGERQRLNFALAVVGRPELLILDEPTAAMDVAARRSTWDLLRRCARQGTTVVLTTHLSRRPRRSPTELAIIDGGTPGRMPAVQPSCVPWGTCREASAAAGTADAPWAGACRPAIDPAGLPRASLTSTRRPCHRIPGTLAVRHLGGTTYVISVGDVGRGARPADRVAVGKHIEPLAIEVDRPRAWTTVFLRLTDG